MHQSDFKPQNNTSGFTSLKFNPAKRLSLQSSFPNLNSAPMGPAPSTPQFGSTELSKLGTITSNFGSSTRGEAFHPGVDVAAKFNTPVPAYAGGKVIESVAGKKQGDKGFGNTIVVLDAKGNKWRYSHLYGNYVKAGSTLKTGQILGTMGRSGNVYSAHGGDPTHLDLRIRDSFNKYQDPMKFFRKTT